MQHFGMRSRTGWLRVKIMCHDRVTGLPWDCLSSELVHLKYKAQPFGLVQGRIHINITLTCFRPNRDDQDIDEQTYLDERTY